MEVIVETTEGLGRRMRVQIPEERIAGEVDNRLRTMSRTARVPGFRPGKVPVKVVAQRYGRKVRDEVVGEMVRTSYLDAIAEHKLRPAGNPTFDAVESVPGRGLDYVARFEVYPDLETPKLDGLSLERPRVEITDADVDTIVETLRRQRRRWEPVERAAAEGDLVTIDFEGRLDGEPFDGGTATAVEVELGAGRVVDDLERGLAGLSAGDARDLDVRFPDTYHQEGLAGKAVVFSVRVQSVAEAVLPEVDEEFAKGFGVGEGGVDGLRAEVRRNMEREAGDAVAARVKEGIMDCLLELNPVSPPHSLVHEETHRMYALRRSELLHQGANPDELGLEPEMFAEQAQRRIVLGLLLAELVRQNGLAADEVRVRAKIDDIASTYEDPAKVVSWYYADRSRLAEVQSTVLEDQVVEWLLERVTVTDRPMSFDELLNPGQTSASRGPDGGA